MTIAAAVHRRRARLPLWLWIGTSLHLFQVIAYGGSRAHCERYGDLHLRCAAAHTRILGEHFLRQDSHFRSVETSVDDDLALDHLGCQ